MPSSTSFLPNSSTGISADKFLPALQHAISGSAGTLISTCTLYPLSLVITRLQVQRQLRREGRLRDASRLQNSNKAGAGAGTTTTDPSGADPVLTHPDGIAAVFSQIWSSGGGPRAFYTGLAQDAAKSVLDSFLFFLFYEWFRGLRLAARSHRKKGSDRRAGLAVLEELAVGMAAGACSRLFTTPIANVVTRKQTASLVDGGAGEGASVREILNEIRKEKGIAGLWSGYSASLVLTLNPSITFFLQEFLKKQTVPADKWDHPAAHVTFLLAAFSKVVASTITYPFQTAKTRLQAGVPVGPPESPKGRDVPPKEETLIDLASNEAQASEGTQVPREEAIATKAPKEGEAEAKATVEGEAPAEATAPAEEAPQEAAAKEPEELKPRVVHQENVAPPERSVEREVDAKLDALKAVKDMGKNLGKRSIFGTVAHIARTEGVASLYDGIGGELLKAFLSHGTTMVAKDIIHKLLFKLYIFIASVLAELRVRRVKRSRTGAEAGATMSMTRVKEEATAPKPSRLPPPQSESKPEPEFAGLSGGPRPPPRGTPVSIPRKVPEPSESYNPTTAPPPRTSTYLPPDDTQAPAPAYSPLPPPPPPYQQIPPRYRMHNDYDTDIVNASMYHPPTPYVYRPPLPPAPATDVSVRTRLSRNDIERATPSVLEDFAVNVVANMIDGARRAFKDDD